MPDEPLQHVLWHTKEVVWTQGNDNAEYQYNGREKLKQQKRPTKSMTLQKNQDQETCQKIPSLDKTAPQK